MSVFFTHSRSAIALLLGAGLAACQTMPPPPLFVPHDQTRSYGYSERSIADNVYEVSYLTPLRDVAFGPVARAADIDAAKRTAEDLARWRAAELALERGFAGFTVTDTRTDAEVTDRRYDFIGPRYPFSLHQRFPFAPYHDPFYYHGLGYGRETVAQVRATLTVTLHDTVGGDAEDAEVVRNRLRQKYPKQDARLPVAPPPSPPDG